MKLYKNIVFSELLFAIPRMQLMLPNYQTDEFVVENADYFECIN